MIRPVAYNGCLRPQNDLQQPLYCEYGDAVFRSLLVRSAADSRSLQTVGVTSCLYGEGVTTVSSKLAWAAAFH